MSRVAVLGAGAGGMAACVELGRAGHEVRLWNRSAATLDPIREAGAIRHEGVLGDGLVRPARITGELAAAIDGADVVMVCLPALVHDQLFRELAGLELSLPVVLHPGHTGGALHLRARFRERGVACPPAAELSTLAYVARKAAADRVRIGGVAGSVRGAALPGGDAALALARTLLPCVDPVPDVLATSLCNVNLVLHPPGALLAAAWVESSGGDFTFYVEAMTSGVARVIEALDSERRAVAAAFGHRLPTLAEEMARIGTADADAAARGDTRAAIATGEPNRAIRAPDSLAHRYYVEDFAFGLVPFRVLAAIAGVPTPVADALLALGSTLTGRDHERDGLGPRELGIEGVTRDGLMDVVRNGAPLSAAAR